MKSLGGILLLLIDYVRQESILPTSEWLFPLSRWPVSQMM